jgi:hypothetical protein
MHDPLRPLDKLDLLHLGSLASEHNKPAGTHRAVHGGQHTIPNAAMGLYTDYGELFRFLLVGSQARAALSMWRKFKRATSMNPTRRPRHGQMRWRPCPWRRCPLSIRSRRRDGNAEVDRPALDAPVNNEGLALVGPSWGDGGAPPGTRTPNRCLKSAKQAGS